MAETTETKPKRTRKTPASTTTRTRKTRKTPEDLPTSSTTARSTRSRSTTSKNGKGAGGGLSTVNTPTSSIASKTDLPTSTESAAIDFVTAAKAQVGAPTDIQVPNALEFIPQDFTTDSSTLAPVTDEDAAIALEGIHQKGNAMKIVQENMKLTQQAVVTHGLRGQLLSKVAQVASVYENVNTDVIKHQQTVAGANIEALRLQHKAIEQQGLEAQTVLIQARIEAQQLAARARIAKIEAQTAKVEGQNNMILAGANLPTTTDDINTIDIEV